MFPDRVLSGMRPTGALHLGHYHGVLKNWVKLQHEYPCLFFVADWHALTTHYEDPEVIEQNVWDMVIDWLAAGVDPSQATLFIQSRVPEHAELHLLLSMITPLGWLERVPTYKDQQEKLADRDLSTYGFLGYPLLQGADILIYRATRCRSARTRCRTSSSRARSRGASTTSTAASRASRKRPRRRSKKLGSKRSKLYRELRTRYQEQGDDEALEAGRALLDEAQNLSMGDRERLFGYLEGGGKMILAEPEALLTEASKMPGLDGQKMSKSYNNTITLREDADSVTQKIRTMPTDPARVRRTDPGDPEKCPVWQLHLVYSDDKTKRVGAEGLPHRGHRLPRMQATGDRRRAQGAGADARARAGLPGDPTPGAQHHRGRLRQGAQAGRRDHARRARGDGLELQLSRRSSPPLSPRYSPTWSTQPLPIPIFDILTLVVPAAPSCLTCPWQVSLRRKLPSITFGAIIAFSLPLPFFDGVTLVTPAAADALNLPRQVSLRRKRPLQPFCRIKRCLLSLPILLFDILTLVMLFLAFGETHLELDPAAAVVQVERHERIAGALDFTDQPLDLLACINSLRVRIGSGCTWVDAVARGLM